MPAKAPHFSLFFEAAFLDAYSILPLREKKSIDKAVQILSANPRHPSLNVHKARGVNARYPAGGKDVFIAYASKVLRFTFEYGPEPGTISLRNCGYHDTCERKI